MTVATLKYSLLGSQLSLWQLLESGVEEDSLVIRKGFFFFKSLQQDLGRKYKHFHLYILCLVYFSVSCLSTDLGVKKAPNIFCRIN